MISAIVRLTPSDLDFSQNLPMGTTATVMRTVTYRIGTVQDNKSIDDGVEGLIRDESPGLPDSNSPDAHSNSTRSDLLAPEVKKIKLTYYDGLCWNDNWDLTQSGAPILVQVEVGIKTFTLKNLDSDGLRWYRATIALPPAPSSSSSESSSPSSSSSGSSGTSGSTGSSGAATGGAGS
jgi:hypothetical protein